MYVYFGGIIFILSSFWHTFLDPLWSVHLASEAECVRKFVWYFYGDESKTGIRKNTREALERSLSGTHVWRRVVVVAFGSIVPTVSHSIGLCTFVPCPGTIQWKGINSLLPIDYSSGFNGFGRGEAGNYCTQQKSVRLCVGLLACMHS